MEVEGEYSNEHFYKCFWISVGTIVLLRFNPGNFFADYFVKIFSATLTTFLLVICLLQFYKLYKGYMAGKTKVLVRQDGKNAKKNNPNKHTKRLVSIRYPNSDKETLYKLALIQQKLCHQVACMYLNCHSLSESSLIMMCAFDCEQGLYDKAVRLVRSNRLNKSESRVVYSWIHANRKAKQLARQSNKWIVAQCQSRRNNAFGNNRHLWIELRNKREVFGMWVSEANNFAYEVYSSLVRGQEVRLIPSCNFKPDTCGIYLPNPAYFLLPLP